MELINGGLMGVVFRNKKEIPIPEGLHVNHSDGRVFVIRKDAQGRNKRIVYGYTVSATTMHVNDTFKTEFPNVWKQYYGSEDQDEYNLRCGMYLSTLVLACSSGVYSALCDSIGPAHANVITDFCMYLILTESNCVQLYEDQMKDQVLFSEKCYSDSWYSRFFNQNFSNDLIHKFKIYWIQKCKSNGSKKVWISVGGSKHDSKINVEGLVKKRRLRARNNSTLVSYIYAVDAETGMPITYFVNNGGKVDSKAFNEICKFLEDNQIEVEGYLLDKAFFTQDVIKQIKEKGKKYVIMLPKNAYAHQNMMQEYSEKIRWKVDTCVETGGISGVSDYKQLYESDSFSTYVSTFFDADDASACSIHLMNKIIKAKDEIIDRITEGKIAKVPRDLEKYMSIEGVGNNRQVVINNELWQNEIDEKGFFSIAASENYGPKETLRLYRLREAAETQYMIMKSIEGQGISRVYQQQGIESKLLACFVAGIIRNKILKACKEENTKTSEMIRELNRIRLQLKSENRYCFVKNYTKRLEKLLRRLGIAIENIDVVAEDVSNRKFGTIKSQEHKLPKEITQCKSKVGRPRIKPIGEKRRKGKPGRPKGSLNKKTLERLAFEKAHPELKKPKRKPGRPKGSLGKKTIERLEREKANLEHKLQNPPKKGRPKGSLNKKTLERLAFEEAHPELKKPKRGRGRSKGSLNKGKAEEQIPSQQIGVERG